jgi:hypothetical protein
LASHWFYKHDWFKGIYICNIAKDWHIGSLVSEYVGLYQNIHSKTLGTAREYEAKKVKNTMNQI